MLISRFALNIKNNYRAALRVWSFELNSLITERTGYLQYIFRIYRRFYEYQHYKDIFHSVHKKVKDKNFRRRNILYALGITLLATIGVSNENINWRDVRLSVKNFGYCSKDIEFITTLSSNIRCQDCITKRMKYCYCTLGNEKCVSDSGTLSIKNCNNNLEVRSSVEDGSAMIEGADENHWRPFLNKNELSIWTRDESGNRNSYKVYASYDDINAMDLLNVQTDLDYRKEWDQTAVKLDIIETDPENYANSHLIYWEMQWPKFFANRDYVFSRRYVIDREHNIILIANRGIEHPDFPENKSLIRVRDYWSYMIIMPYTHFDEPGVHFVLTYFDDPGISIPTTLQTWVTEKQMPDFLNRMYEATKQYGSRLSVRNLRTFNQFKITYAYQDKLAKLKKLWKVPTQRSSTPRDLDRDSFKVKKKAKTIET